VVEGEVVEGEGEVVEGEGEVVEGEGEVVEGEVVDGEGEVVEGVAAVEDGVVVDVEALDDAFLERDPVRDLLECALVDADLVAEAEPVTRGSS